MDKKKNKSEGHGSPIFRDSEYNGNGNEKQETIKEIFKSILQTKNVQMRRFKWKKGGRERRRREGY